MDIGYFLVIVIIAIVVTNLCLGWYLILQFMASLRAKESIARWGLPWIAGCLATAGAGVIIYGGLMQKHHGQETAIGVFILLIGDVFWINAVSRVMRATDSSLTSPAADEPRDDVWPPPPQSRPHQ